MRLSKFRNDLRYLLTLNFTC